MPPISAVIIALNEAEAIARALRSVSWADEMLVVDSGSTDGTGEIAVNLGARVVTHAWPGYAAQKNYAAGQARHDWGLSLDGEGELDAQAQAVLRAWMSSEPPPDLAGCRFARRARFLGRWIRHSGWYPDHKVRLYDRRRARWQGDYVHESLRLRGSIETLPGEILHYTCDSLEEFRQRIELYAELGAQEMAERREQPGALMRALAPWWRFLHAYVLRLGFLDGSQGLLIAQFEADYVRQKFAKAAHLRPPGLEN